MGLIERKRGRFSEVKAIGGVWGTYRAHRQAHTRGTQKAVRGHIRTKKRASTPAHKK